MASVWWVLLDAATWPEGLTLLTRMRYGQPLSIRPVADRGGYVRMWRCHIITPTPRLPYAGGAETPRRRYIPSRVKVTKSRMRLRITVTDLSKGCVMKSKMLWMGRRQGRDAMDCHRTQKKKSKEFCEMRLLKTADIFFLFRSLARKARPLNLLQIASGIVAVSAL
ncbi:hypothetical protein GW17_00019305 [Ensete ventricosum]|nr:hypothetical protein GW17_00019305 [Ensete ventricosum]